MLTFGRVPIEIGAALRAPARTMRPLFPALEFAFTQSAFVAYVLAAWRLGADLEWTGQFFVSNGVLSHWQVWLAAAFLLQASGTAVGRLGRGER